jgi:hypothetical protein
MVVNLRDVQALSERLPCQCTPTGSLHGHRRFGHLSHEPVERTEELVDAGRELAGGFVTAGRRQVLPEKGVQHVPGEVERELLLEAGDRLEVVRVARGAELVEHGVEP